MYLLFKVIENGNLLHNFINYEGFLKNLNQLNNKLSKIIYFKVDVNCCYVS